MRAPCFGPHPKRRKGRVKALAAGVLQAHVSPEEKKKEKPMQLDVVSDTVCPWCYIGKRKLDAALAERVSLGKSLDLIEIKWRPYQLDPSIPAGGYDRRAYMEKKFGPDRARSIGNNIREMGETLGINFNFEKIQRSPNTLDSHRLIRWAGTAGVQNLMVEILFRRYFTDGEDIGNLEVLVDAARETGMDHDIVRELLGTDADLELVRKEEEVAREMGISGVPSFIINTEYMLVGAQESALFLRMFDRLAVPQAEAQA